MCGLKKDRGREMDGDVVWYTMELHVGGVKNIMEDVMA
jgi:hypothetical protein